MNYLFARPGLIINGDDLHYDYSDNDDLQLLDEALLFEVDGIGGSQITDTLGTKYVASFPYLCVSPASVDADLRFVVVDDISQEIDWNCNFIKEADAVAANINGDNDDDGPDQLRGHDDWKRISLGGIK